jgi:hypothetical protein
LKHVPLIILGLALLTLMATDAQAVDQVVGGASIGRTIMSLTDGPFGAQCWAFGVDSTNPFTDCVEDNSPDTNQIDAGACLTVYYWEDTELVPVSPAPDDWTLTLEAGESTSTIRTLHNGGGLVSGDNWEVCGTHNGLSGGDERSGIMRLRMQLSASGPTGYTCDSDLDDPPDCEPGSRGAVRSNAKVLQFDTTSSPPNGSCYAFGPTGNEEVDFRIQITPPFTGQTDTEATVVFNVTGANPHTPFTSSTVSVPSNGIIDVTDTIDGTYEGLDGALGASDDDYAVWVTIGGRQGLGDSMLWTRWATTGHNTDPSDSTTRFTGVDGSAQDNIAYREDVFCADGRIGARAAAQLDSSHLAVTDHDVYNRGETVTYQVWGLNARDEVITKTATLRVRDSGAGTTEDTDTTTATAQDGYQVSYTVASGDLAEADFIGRGKLVRLSYGGGVTQDDTGTSWNVSSLYRVDMHPQTTGTLIEDPFDDSAETNNYVISVDQLFAYSHVGLARGHAFPVDTNSQQVTYTLRNPDDVIIDTDTSDTGADGWDRSTNTFTVEAPGGIWTITASVTGNGNTGTDTEAIGFISAFTGNLQVRVYVVSTALAEAETTIGVVTVIQNLTTGVLEPIVPDTLPTVSGFYFTVPGGETAFISGQATRNLIDDTETVNGNQYYVNVTMPDTGTVPAMMIAQVTVQGAPLLGQQALTISRSVFTFDSTVDVEFTQLPDLLGLLAMALLAVSWWRGWIFLGFISFLIVFDALVVQTGMSDALMFTLLASAAVAHWVQDWRRAVRTEPKRRR